MLSRHELAPGRILGTSRGLPAPPFPRHRPAPHVPRGYGRAEPRMHVHVIGVSGTGMGSLAGLLRELGHEVTGSDVAFDPPMGPALKEWGVRCLVGFDPAHLNPRPDLVVIGNVCRKDN